MKIVGLCGGSGSGKGVVADLLSEYGFAHIDTDKIYHELTDKSSPCLNELALAFGDRIVNKNGGLDRRVLAEIVFNSPDNERSREILNEIAHRYVLCEVRRLLPMLEEQGYVAALVDAPLLFESGFDRECDNIVAVLAPRRIRIQRICARDGIDSLAAQRRIDSQLSDEYLLSHSDYCITNDSDLDELRSSCESLVEKIINNV